MANTRLMLWFAFAAILYLNYEAWMRDYQQPASAAAVTMPAGAVSASKSLADTLPTAPTTPITPGTATPAASTGSAPAAPTAPSPPAEPGASDTTPAPAAPSPPPAK